MATGPVDPLEALTAEQLAELWQVAPRDVRAMIKGGLLPYFWINGKERVPREDAKRWMDRQTLKACAPRTSETQQHKSSPQKEAA